MESQCAYCVGPANALSHTVVADQPIPQLGMRAHVSVDPSKCQGTGFCAHIAEGYFRIGRDGVSETIRTDVDPADLKLVEEAEDTCPMRAIALRYGGIDA